MNTMKRLMAGMLVSGILTMVASAATTNDMTSGGSAIPAGAIKRAIVCGECKFLNATTWAAFDVYKVITVPSNTFVGKVFLDVITTNTGSSVSLSIGDSGATNTYLAATSFGSGGFTQATNVYNTAGGHLYTSADFLSIVPGVACTDGVVRVYAEMFTLQK